MFFGKTGKTNERVKKVEIGIVNGKQNSIDRDIIRRYENGKRNLKDSFSICQMEYSEMKNKPDILLITESGSGKAPPSGKAVRCRILLLPDNMESGFIEADEKVVYGMSAKDSVTMSSIKDKDCVLEIRREIFDIGGRKIEPREIKAIRKGGMSPMDLMASAACAILMGAEAEKIF